MASDEEQAGPYRPPSAASVPVRTFSPSVGDADEGITLGARVAGVILILNALSTFYAGIALNAPMTGLGGGTSAVVDVLLGVLLIAGQRKVVPFCIVRVVLGALILVGLRLYTGDVISAVLQVALSGSLLGLLLGNASLMRVGLSSGLATSYLIAAAVILHGATRARSSDTLLASGEIEIIPEGTVQGFAAAYHFGAPSDRWFLRNREVAMRENPIADLWLVRPDKDAHFIVIVENFGEGQALDVDAYRTAVMKNLEDASTSVQVLETGKLWEHYEQSRRVHVRAALMGLSIDYLYGLFVFENQAYQLIGFASQTEYPSVSGEFDQMFETFVIGD